MNTFNVVFDSTSTVQFTSPTTKIEAARIMRKLGMSAFMYEQDYPEISKEKGQRAGEYDAEDGKIRIIGESGSVLYEMEL